MNLSAIVRKFPPFRSARSRSAIPAIEPLEARIAPATLVNPTTVTFQDKNGDAVTVTISKPLFTQTNVANVFTFDNGFNTGDNTVQQQLETFDVTHLGHAAAGLSISITAVPVSSSPGVVNVGYINASNIDLGTVTVGGDLGRIAAGDTNHATQGLHSLKVESLGAQGIATQATGGNLNTLLSGPVGSITVNGDIDGASIGIGGGARGSLASLLVTGSIIGGGTDFSASLRTQGNITTVVVDGSIVGGGGASSGVIGTAGSIGTILVKGSVTGGGGAFSGAILASKSITSVTIVGDLTGGAGDDSGEVGTASNLGTAKVESSVIGGGGTLSGVILASGNITSVTVANGLVGGSGPDSGQIGSGKSVQAISIGSDGISLPALLPLDGTFQGIEGGSGPSSGTILVHGSITSLTVGGDINFPQNLDTVTLKPALSSGTLGTSAGAISAGGSIQTVNITGSVYDGGIFSGASIGAVTIGGTLSQGSEIHARQSIASVSVDVAPVAAPGLRTLDSTFDANSGPGISNSSILADLGSIGSIQAGGSGYSSAYAIANASIAAGTSIGSIEANSNGADAAIFNTEVFAASLGDISAYAVGGTGISGSTFTATQGIGNITGESISGGETSGYGIYSSTFQAGAGIASITAIGTSAPILANQATATATGIEFSGFNTGASIGAINSAGTIDGSAFVAGIDLGSGFTVTGAGSFNNTVAAAFGFGGSKSTAAAHIGNITLANSGGPSLISQSTFLAGVHGSGADTQFGTKDDSVPAGSTIGSITSPGGLNVDFFESGSIGTTTSGALDNAIYLSTDPVGAVAGIGLITVTLPVTPLLVASSAAASGLNPEFVAQTGFGIHNSVFTSNGNLGGINITLDGVRTGADNAAVESVTILAGGSIGPITIINNATGTAGHNYGIAHSTFTAGITGAGGIGAINVTITDASVDGNTAAIFASTFDAGSGVGANIGNITAENADLSSNASGILDSTFRVHGSIGNISSTMDNGNTLAPAIQGSIFSAFGSIGNITVKGAVLPDQGNENDIPSRFLAGYDIGSDLTFGNENLGANSPDLQGGQSVGNVSITGTFAGSDLIASVNPGSGYVFGDSISGTSPDNDSNVGSGGSIGLVSIGTGFSNYIGNPFISDTAVSHAIEAKTFALGSNSVPMVSAFGSTSTIPVVMTFNGANDVRITNLTQAAG